MRTYEYRGFDGNARAAKGLIEALDLKDARERLAERGILAEKVSPAGAKTQQRRFSREQRFDLDARATIYRELGALLKAGLPLAEALDVLINAPEIRDLHGMLANVRDRIREGSALGPALAEASTRVKPFEQAAIEVGETSGNLDTALERLASFLEEQQSIRDRAQTALIYPMIVLGLAVVIASVMLGVMIPRFANLFAEARIELPTITRVLISSGPVFRVVGLGVPLLIVLGVILVRSASAKNSDFQQRVDSLIFRLPLWGRAYTALVNLRFARTLSLLLEGGVSLVDGIPLAGRATASSWVMQLNLDEATAVEHGSSLADAVRRIPPLSGSLTSWIQAGEASGDLAPLLDKAATRYQQQWDRLVLRSLEVLEPVLILFVGALVLLLALAVLTPVLSLNSALL